MLGFIADYEFIWGFQSRIVGLSKTSPSFYYPPPTTFIGALSEVIARTYEIGERDSRKLMKIISDNILAIAWKPLNCIPIRYSDINRIIAIKKTRGMLYPNPKNLSGSFDAPARGKTLLWSFNDKSPQIRWILVFEEENIDFNGKNLQLSEDLFWMIHRLGSKESIVSAIRVKKVNVDFNNVERDIVITTYSFPLFSSIKNKKEIWPKWTIEEYLNPKNNNSYLEPLKAYLSEESRLCYVIPIRISIDHDPTIRLTIENGRVYYIDGINGKKETIIGW